MTTLFKIIVFLFSSVVNFLSRNILERKLFLFVASSNLFLLFLALYITGFDLISFVLSALAIILFAFIIYHKYILTFDRLEEKMRSAYLEIQESKNVKKAVESIKKLELGGVELSPIVDLLKHYGDLLLSEKESVQRMQNLLMLLTNFARYSFGEQDKEKLIKELNNFVYYAFPQKKIWVIKYQDIQKAKFLEEGLDSQDLMNIKMGKLEGENYTAFPIMENGSPFAYIVLKDRLINEYEKLFFYLISRMAEAVVRRIEREREIELKAITDPLTNIYNRRYLIQHLEQLFAKFRRLGSIYSFIIFDIDGFKKINDTYGHYVGDEILRLFANTIKNSIRGYDIPARFGGDEFVILIDGAGKEDSVNIARRITKKFEISEAKNLIKEGVSASWGLAVVNEAPGHFEDIIKLADRRLLKAKMSGKGVGVWE